ncbi:MAG: radical SAM protein [Pseudohongiella sp.]|jgi:uncharacterized Fe-S cluster-containing radical SAM superfamily protein|nr:radical SAM protein [Pseudohongiella sp.]
MGIEKIEIQRLPLQEIRGKKVGEGKFVDPDFTATGDARAWVEPRQLETLWINTGSLCNLSCEHCYIESTPTNDRLAYISEVEVETLLDEIAAENFATEEIAFTGGEPFLNEELIPILRLCLQRGFKVLVLSNAMKTMTKYSDALLELNNLYTGKLNLRISLDHYSEELHARERGKRSWKPAIAGLKWLSSQGFSFSVAGRTYWGEPEQAMREGYASLFLKQKINLDADDVSQLILFPEMDLAVDVPEITTACWEILQKNPAEIMCSNSRMVVKRKEDNHLSVMACTLLPYDQRFNMGKTLTEAWQPIKLNHPHCAKFCVLGGGSCSG